MLKYVLLHSQLGPISSKKNIMFSSVCFGIPVLDMKSNEDSKIPEIYNYRSDAFYRMTTFQSTFYILCYSESLIIKTSIIQNQNVLQKQFFLWLILSLPNNISIVWLNSALISESNPTETSN